MTRTAAQATGLLEGTPVVIGGGDGACATAGAGVVSEGDGYNYIGSSSWIALASPRPIYDPQRRIFCFAHLDPALVCPMGTMQTAGGAYRWLAGWLHGPSQDADAYKEMDGWAGRVAPGAENLLFLPYLMGERSPYWNPAARGAFIGLSMRHGPEHAARAVLEGVAFNLRLILEALTEQGLTLSALRRGSAAARAAPSGGRYWRTSMACRSSSPSSLPRRPRSARPSPGAWV